MPRSRIEGLLASFPKLIGSSDQHTFVETDSVRYVYQPLDELYMVLITNRQSNILQDIDTLHLFARVVSEYCRSTDERDISRQSFELLNVFDEIIAMGYRESINLAQIRTITEMESHEERIQAEIEKNREKEAKDELNRKARMMDMQRREMAKKGISGGVPNISGVFGGNSGAYSGYKQPSQQSHSEPTPQQSSYDSYSSQSQSSKSTSLGKGMQLGRKQKTDALFQAVKTEEGIEDVGDRGHGVSGSGASQPVHMESVHVTIEEKIELRVNRDGALENMDVKGALTLLVAEARPGLKLKLKPSSNDSISFNTHPKVDKELFANGIIGLKTGNFPVGTPVEVLRWRFATKDESAMPLAINCWPSPSGSGSCDVNIEYDLQNERLELRDVTITIPYPGNSPPSIGDSEGHHRIDRQRKFIEWQLPLIDGSNKSGVLEFSVDSEDVGSFFPIQVYFTSPKTICELDVVDAQAGDGVRAQFSKESRLLTGQYSVV
ncbi:Coatomer subunit delta [Phlyctochytrium planicorne]|nr:Coatomer subunit delta [Phlyctochytrium planicorne]